MTKTEKFSLAGKKMSFYMQVAIPKLLSLGDGGGNFGDHAFCHFKNCVVKICVLFPLQLLGIKS